MFSFSSNSWLSGDNELSDGYAEETEDVAELDDLIDTDEDSLFEGLDDEEILLDDTDLGEDNLLNDQDLLDENE